MMLRINSLPLDRRERCRPPFPERNQHTGQPSPALRRNGGPPAGFDRWAARQRSILPRILHAPVNKICRNLEEGSDATEGRERGILWSKDPGSGRRCRPEPDSGEAPYCSGVPPGPGNGLIGVLSADLVVLQRLQQASGGDAGAVRSRIPPLLAAR